MLLRKRNQAGFTVIEAMLVLAVSALAATLMVQNYAKYSESLNVKSAADHGKLISEAAAKYIEGNYSALVSVATPTTPAVITTTMLKNTNFLSSAVADKNGYGQGYQVLVIEPSANRLEALITTTGGQAIREMSLRDIARNLGGKGGFISNNDTANATGNYGAWKVPLSTYSTAPGGGHIAMALFFDNGNLTNDYLNRSAVAGHPEVNRMNTSIDLNSNNLNNVATIAATTANVTGTTTTANATVTGTTSTGTADVQGETYTGGWFRARGDGMIYSERWGGGLYMSDPTWLRSYADKSIYTGGTMLANNLQSLGRTTVGEYLQINGIAAKDTGCSPNGLVGRDATGKLLSCDQGIWKNSAELDFTVANCVMNNYQQCVPQCPPGYTLKSYSGMKGQNASYWDDRYFAVGVCTR
ncbi:shufflon system plasmid conjugative transfer pilus tip adhesin PilV [Pseudomonas sp. DCB_CB]|uniref:shufflon system plasmid conjugative transfer pilus tip adhesin PilV n=1 Tax=unclassified Pseudomonas TaxID=196821 RepID=UPI00224955CF|nr:MULTISPECIES: shufflon system plasmid conjugative transfer pilus tip adhesin PilV [unclassified Pseudomonas]MCX2694505.1 shufflon system plasmid conjugative transfer pilus tip adhesin PilV [Pseudomonas sp. DCB_BZ]MCX2859665.1 shufflon system plasmid conjugative transfer pilus tip adhesin PilV [Pseudomonas sp. DCB_CB]